MTAAADLSIGGDLASNPGPTVESLSVTSGPAGTVLLVNGAGLQLGDTVQISGATISTTALATISLSATAVLAAVPSVGVPPPADILVRVSRGLATFPASGLPFHVTPGHAYYLSPTGNDGGAGTLAQPWRTVSAASGKMAPGDVAYLRGGTYSGQAIINASGNASAPLTFTAYPGESPLLVEPATSAGSDLDAVRVYGAYLVLDHLRVSDQNNPGQGIWIADQAHHVTIANCEVFGTHGQGILISGNNNTVYRSHIHDNGAHAKFDHGIYVNGANNVIRSNVIHDNFTWGVQLYNGYVTGTTGAGNNLVEFNYVYSNGFGSMAAASDTTSGGFVIANAQSNNILRNNIVCGNAQYGIYVIDSEPNNQIIGNITCYNAQGGLFMRYPGSGNVLTGNISYNDSAFALSSNPGVTSDNNVYYRTAGAPQFAWAGTSYSFAAFKSASGQDAHSQLTELKFTNVPSTGFVPSAASSYNFCSAQNIALCQPLP